MSFVVSPFVWLHFINALMCYSGVGLYNCIYEGGHFNTNSLFIIAYICEGSLLYNTWILVRNPGYMFLARHKKNRS